MREQPLPVRVASEIRQRIEDGEFRVGQKLPSERQLAERADVSRQVVRQALADLSRLGILDCQPRCRPVVLAGLKPLNRQKIRDKKIYLLVFPHVSDFIAAQLLKGVQQGIIDPQINLAISTPAGGRSASAVDSERQQLLSIAADPMASGVIIWYIGGLRNLAALQAVRQAGIPIVFVDREAPRGFEADYVGTDNFEAARKAVDHLAEIGHERIGMLSNLDPVSSVQERQDGYRAALADAGVNFEPEWMTAVDLEGTTFEEAIKRAIERLLQLPNPPTAIFAVNDQIGIRMFSVLTEMKIRVPEEMSVVGFDGWLRWVPGGGNLTSAAQQFERIGHLATRVLLERMEHGKPQSYRHVILEAPLILQGSTRALGKPQPAAPAPITLQEVEV
jgi:LacI family transcriptional regulator